MRLCLRLVVMAWFVAMTLGFRTLGDAHWGITREDPTVWIKPCDAIAGTVFTASSEDPPSDPVSSLSDRGIRSVLQTIADDFNGVTTSFMRMALYPVDENNPPAPLPGDSPFTKEAAANRTITICAGSQPGAGVAGHARPVVSGKTITSCSVSLGEIQSDCASCFVGILTHELGHCFYLAHPQEGTHAIMSYYRQFGRRLMHDDKIGLTFLYPSDPDAHERVTGGLSCAPL